MPDGETGWCIFVYPNQPRPMCLRTSYDKCVQNRGTWYGVEFPPGCAVDCLLSRVFAGQPASLLWHVSDLKANLQEIRDGIMAPSQAGARIVAHYYQHADEIASIVRSDPELVATVVEDTVVSGVFAGALLRAARKGYDDTDIQVSRALFESEVRVFDAIRRQTDNTELVDALNDVQAQFERMVGLTPTAVLRAIRED